MVGQTAAYVRVSSADQNEARQLEVLDGADKFFIDKLSGKSLERPALTEMLEWVRENDTVRVASLDRLARSMRDMLALVETLTNKGVTVEFVKENLTFNGRDSAMSKMLLGIFASISEWERATIRERQAEGIALAKARGVYKGRARSLSPEQVESARERVAGGVPKAVVARELGVSRQTLYSALGCHSSAGVTV